jgi:hypothetical protein
MARFCAGGRVDVKKSLVGCLLFCFGLAARGQAQTFTLPATADAFLRQGSANQNHGSDATLQLSGDGHVLLRFDQAAIAAAVGSGRLVSASLELFVHSASNWGADGRPVEAHRLTADWTEAGVTWKCATDSNPANGKPDCATQWDGGSFEDDASDSIVQTSAEYLWVPFDVTADVAAFLSGTPNQGWLIAKADDDQNGKVDYGAREGAAAERPRLVLLVETAAHDQVPPVLSITSPNQPILVNQPSPAVVVEYADGGSGVDTATLQVLVDGQDRTAGCATGAQSASCPAGTLAAGNHTLLAKLKDRAGNAAQASVAFQLLLGPGPHLVTFPAVGDTYLRKGDSNTNFGAEPILRVRESGQNRALLQIDAQSLATALSGATVVFASLELHVEKNGRNWGKTGRTVDAHRMTSAWAEAGATWNCPNDSNPTNSKPDCAAQWTGGSFAAAPTASVLHTKDLAGWVRFDVTADVTAFAAGTPDFGWLIKKTDEKKSGRVDYDSRQGTAGEGPRLVVVFATPGGGDTTPPMVAITAPADGSLLATATPTITASYSDGGSGVDPASVRLAVDGVDRTAQATVTASGLTFTPATALAEGAHTIQITVEDRAGNGAATVTHFSIDTAVPVLTITAPGPVIGDPAPVIQLSYSDSGSGLALGTLLVKVDSTALAGCTVGPSTASCPTTSLAAGPHTVEAAIRDLAGNLASASSSFRIDVVPSLAIVAPDRSLYVDPTIPNPVPDVNVQYSSPSPGLDLGTLHILFQSLGEEAGPLDLTAECTIGPASATCPMPIPKDGQFEVDASISDLAGKSANASFRFTVQFSADTAAPVLTVDSPADGAYVKEPILEVTGSVTDDTGVALVLVNGPMATLTGSSFHGQVALDAGRNRIQVTAVDNMGKVAEVTRTVVLDTSAPTVAFTAPENGKVTDQESVTVAVTVGDDLGVAAVSVNGFPATVASGLFTVSMPLTEGTNEIEAIATDLAGNTSTATLRVVRFSPPAVAITSPTQMSLVAAPTVDVRGTVDPPAGSVTVNGIQAVVSGNTFTAQVPLFEGTNVVAAVAATPSGAMGTGTVEVFRDSTAPRMAVAFPLDGATVHQPNVPVGGTVQDNTIVSAGPLRVTVNGIAATVSDGGFLLPAMTLAPGANTLNVVATDPAGNSVHQQVGVRFEPLVDQARISAVSGDLQTGSIRSALAAPLVVSLTDAAGQAAAGRTVVFRITGDDGSLRDGATSGRSLAVQTNAQGRASVSWTLGDRAGLGKNRVRASSAGFTGEALFTASAQHGAATRLQLDTGNNQTGVAGRPLARPFVVVATDEALNPVAGALLTFQVTKGDGSLAGQPAIHAVTGEEGRASVFLTLGPEEGSDNNVVTTTLDGPAGGAAIFYASGQVAGAPEATTVSGVVLDNVDTPVPGVTLRIPGSALTAQTDTAGRFSFGPAPVGDIRLVVDGSTTTRPGAWPDLEFDLTTVPGRDNTLGRPIYLLPLDLAHGLLVDETHGGALTLPEVPGFSLEVAPGSATFPGGSRSGVVSVTLVHADKVPMVPSLGQQPQFTVTIQPPGILFNPPAKVTLPNVEGFPPGAITQIFSFLHDQGQFEAVGPATVSDDGARVVSDPGFGIVHGGWHYQPPRPDPDPPGNGCHCPQCQRCIVGACGIFPGTCDDHKFCTEHDTCQSGVCKGDKIEDVELGEISAELSHFGKFLKAVQEIINGLEPLSSDEEAPESRWSGSVKTKSYKRCCEERRDILPGEKISTDLSFTLKSKEKRIPIPWTPLPGLEFELFVGYKASLQGEGAKDLDPCGGASACVNGLEFAASGSVTGYGGLRALLISRDLLSVAGGVRGSGTISVKVTCEKANVTGSVGPFTAFAEVVVLDFIHITPVHEFESLKASFNKDF